VVPVAPGASGLYLTDLPENETLEVSLGVASSGGFVEITASSILRTPPRTLRSGAQTHWRSHETGREVPGYQGIVGIERASADDLRRNLPSARPARATLSVLTPAPNPRAVPARR
jgi:hypothetical protein